ncbi:MAG: beta-lactamase family protein [Caldilineaceae bacterium]|nr:beta-lactamase family protein [Caldilineaceae bacterium]
MHKKGIAAAAAQGALDMSEIDRFVAEQMDRHNLPGLALAITHGNQVVHLRGYGTARAGQPMTLQTQFFIASLSKSFTAVAIMQLVEAGQIDLDTPVQEYLPQFTLTDATVARQITIRHLLNQTSGLADTGYPEGRLPQPTTFEQLLSSLSKARPVAAPGTEFHYFNPNYQLLARVVEVVSGEPFSAYLQTHIFAPLRMTHTFNVITSDEVMQRAENLAQGHVMAFGIPIATQEMSGFLGGSGGVISTAEDMANYLIMQNNGGRFAGESIVAPSSIALMHTAPQSLDSTYAMGWFAPPPETTAESTTGSTRILEHNGVLSVFYADMALLPETGDGLLLLYNTSSLASNSLAAPQIKSGLVALLTGTQPTTGGMSLRIVGALVGLATLIGAALAIRSLLRLPRWRQKAQALPAWRLLLGLTGTFTPVLILLGLPSLVTASSGRAFSYAQLFRSMPDLFIWLGLGTVLGAINGVTRIFLLIRSARSES